MKRLTSSFALILLILFQSCNSDDNPTQETEYNFSINQDKETIQELDDVTFTIQNPNSAIIGDVKWYINDEEYNGSHLTFEKQFQTFGDFTLKAVINYNNSLTKTVEKQISVIERPKSLVKIKKIEILSYTQANNYHNIAGYYMKTKFDIKELDASANEIIKYLSTENSQNWGVGSMIYPMSWDISNANYKAKVYESGNYYPNNQPGYNTKITFYGAKELVGVQQPFGIMEIFELDLNPYRSVRPTTINVSSAFMEIRLTLQWN